MQSSNWPFDSWLKLAVRGFRITPKAFWSMTLRDWLIITQADNAPAMRPDELLALSLQFPDEVKNDSNKCKHSG